MKKENEITRIASGVFDDAIVETIYDIKEETTKFAVYQNGKVDMEERIKIERGELLYPFSGQLHKAEFLRLPTGIEAYASHSELYERIRSFIAQYVRLSDPFLSVCAGYVMMTWVYDCFNTVPYLRVIGDFGTGKSRFLTTIGSICNKGMFAGGAMSKAAIYRTIDPIRGTLIVDEADFKNSEMWSEIVKIWNAGHTKGFPVVKMEAGKNGEWIPKAFTVYGPKVLASRERFGDIALESRCLSLQLHLGPLEGIPTDLTQKFYEEATRIRNTLLAFRFKNYFKIKPDESTVEDIEMPRLKQTALALTSVINYVRKERLQEVQEFLKEYQAELSSQQVSDIRVDVLIAIAQHLKDNPITGGKRLYMREIADMFNGNAYDDYTDKDDKQVYRDVGPLYVPAYKVSARKIGALIKKLGIPSLRDSEGIYVPLANRKVREDIESLIKRHGVERYLRNDGPESKN